MRASISLVLLVMCCGGQAFSQDAKMSPVHREVVEAERAFSRYSVSHGQPEAWMEFFTDDGIIFKGGPVNARDFNRKLVPSGMSSTSALSWEPRYGDVSKGGDLGYNIGPWIYVVYATPDRPNSQGFFVTIWKKQLNSKWKESFDFGTPVRNPTADHTLGQPFTPARQYKSKIPSGTKPATEFQRLTGFDREFAERAKSVGALETYLTLVSAEAKVLRIGYTPAAKEALRSYIPAGKEVSLALTPIGGDIASSSDLGYTYGSYQLQQDGIPKESGYYAHVWKRDELGHWKIVVVGFRQDFTKKSN